MAPSAVNYEKHADRLAEVLQEFVFIHSGSDNGIGLQLAFKDALKALLEYRKEFEPVEEKPVKRIMEDAFWLASAAGIDAWGAVLKALADEAHRWTKYSTDDQETTQDIKDWLRAEADKT